MPLEIIHRDEERREERRRLSDCLKKLPTISGTLYLGYPDLLGPPPARVDALLVDARWGLVAFRLDEVGKSHDDLRSDFEQVWSLLEAEVKKEARLRRGTRLKVAPVVVWIREPDHQPVEQLEDENIIACGFTQLDQALKPRSEPLTAEEFQALQAVVQNARGIRGTVTGPLPQPPLARILAEIEREVTSFDRGQLHGALEMVEGPQRIRGLAGSGKTIVLARKAAEIHRRHPERRVAVVHMTRALGPMLEKHIKRFLGDAPWDRETLLVLPAWGSARSPGVYHLLCQALGERTLSLEEAKVQGGFGNVCRALAARWEAQPRSAVLWDQVLIDEAQDLPPGFFKLIWRAMAPPHRIVWAYDELQTLYGDPLPGPIDLFAIDEPSLHLKNPPGEAQRDINLETCYRTPPWTLVAAHGIGLRSAHGPAYAQWVEDPSIWRVIGYEITGEWSPGHQVELRRAEHSTPSFFGQILKPDDALQWQTFSSTQEQDAALVTDVQNDIQSGGLRPEQVLVIFANGRTARARAGQTQHLLLQRGIGAQVAGLSEGPDTFTVPGSVTLSTVYRAKGSEAARVYLVDAGVSASPDPTERSTIFVAMTRSTCWLRVTGVGMPMKLLATELDRIKADGWVLKAVVPTPQELDRVRRLGLDLSPAQKAYSKTLERLSQEIDGMSEETIRVLLERDPSLVQMLYRLNAAREAKD
ncbi:MAG: ATP-binding domain-containing protein [Nannocystis sp.]|nr:ATP-binding domain-containing protein [Nannocystis sp.]